MIFNYLSKYYNFRFGIDGVALNGGHTHQGCSDATGKMCFLTRLEVFLTIELLTNLLQPYDSLKERRYLMNLAQKRGSSFLV
ncbi:MAG: hypothetical protein M3044_08875 [Thermoproteota archaeon]|nr:hypothetical protein [Thermoproteota archaeon]